MNLSSIIKKNLSTQKATDLNLKALDIFVFFLDILSKYYALPFHPVPLVVFFSQVFAFSHSSLLLLRHQNIKGKSVWKDLFWKKGPLIRINTVCYSFGEAASRMLMVGFFCRPLIELQQLHDVAWKPITHTKCGILHTLQAGRVPFGHPWTWQ